MILLVDDDRENRTIRLRDALRACGIPCICIRCAAVRDYPEALFAFVFASSEYHLNTVSLRCGRLPLLCVNESGGRIYNKDVIFFDSARFVSYEDFVIDFMKTEFGITPHDLTVGELTVADGTVSYGVNRLRLTPAEHRILTLLAFCSGKWVSEKNILRTCFDNISTSCRVPVHICNINSKAKKTFGRKLIKCKRGIGYILSEDL